MAPSLAEVAPGIAVAATALAFVGWLTTTLLRSHRAKKWNTVLQALTTRLTDVESRIHRAALSPFEKDRALKELGRGQIELATLRADVTNGQFSKSASLAGVVGGRAERIVALLPETASDPATQQ